MLAGSTSEEAAIVAERIRAAIEALASPHAASSAGDIITLSIGGASCQPHLLDQGKDQGQEISAPMGTAPQGEFYLARELFEQADQALYAAKR